MNVNDSPSIGSFPADNSSIPPRKPPSGGKVAGADDESGVDYNPGRAEQIGAAAPLGVEPGKDTKALIAELQQIDDSAIVDRILADRRVIIAVVHLGQARIDAIALELRNRLTTIAGQSQELAEDPLIHSFIAMMSEDIRRQILRQLNLPEDMEIPPAPGNRVEPPSPPEGSNGLDLRA